MNSLLLAPRGPVRLRIAAAGDVGVIGAARERARRDGYDAALLPFAGSFHDADLAFVNLEFPIGEARDVRPGRSREFWHDPELIPALARAGVGVVSLANNHMMDAGPAGIARTRVACEAAGIAAVGAGRTLDEARTPGRFSTNGQQIALLAYAAPSGDAARADLPGIAPLDLGLIQEDIRLWRPNVDVLVVSVHWGSMYVDFPPPRVLALAQQLADAGADLVLGHHPHVLQGFERRGRTMTIYSLGDAVFNSHAGDFHSKVGETVRLQTGVFRTLIADEPGLEYVAMRLDGDGFANQVNGALAIEQRNRLMRLSADTRNATRRFATCSAPQLLRYELEAVGHHLTHGRFDRLFRLFRTIRPRHLPLLWQAISHW